jgi:DNA-binding MarR family transcriptional regulator
MPERRKPLNVECQTCGKTFPAHQCKLEQGFRKYCSPACRHESNGFRRRVLAALPSSPSRLSEQFKLPTKTIQRILKRGIEEGICHMVKLVRVEGEVPRNTSPYEFWVKPNPRSIVSILPEEFKEAHKILLPHVILGAMPAIQSEIRRKTGLSQSSVCVAIQQLRKEGRCYITKWKRNGTGGAVAVFKAGKHKDATCKIENFTKREIFERYLKKLHKNGELEDYRRRAASRQAIRTKRKSGDPFINALFGKPADRLKEAA